MDIKGTSSEEESFQLSCEVEHADASTQTEDWYSDEDECMVELQPRPHTRDSDSKRNKNHTQLKASGKTVKHTPSRSARENPRAAKTGIASDDSAAKHFECDICRKKLSSLSSFVQHNLTVHTGEKLYQCEYCDRTFRQLGNFASHKRTRHVDSKPYKCKVCDKRFANSSNVAIHMRTHTGKKSYECDVCHKTFNQLSHLSDHKRTHTGELPFECDICKRRFNRTRTMTIHRRIHAGERPYQCDICNKTFKQLGEMSSHRSRHIPTEVLLAIKVAKVMSPSIAKQS